MATFRVFCCLISLFSILLSTLVKAEGAAVGLKVSTLGAGIEAVNSFNDQLNGRFSVQYFKYSDDYSSSSVNYDGDLVLKSVLGTLDYYPFESIFHLSAGALLNGNKIDLRGESLKGATGDNSLVGALLGNLEGNVQGNTIAPYFGLGFGNPVVGDQGGFGFKADVGLVYHGNPTVSLSADGLLAGTPLGQTLIAQEEAELQDDVDGYEWYPVVGLSLFYRF